MGFNIEIKGLDRLIDMISLPITRMMDSAIKETAMQLENDALGNLQDRVYANSPSSRYKRTGAAQQGKEIRKEPRGYRVRFNTKIKGASKNYSPMLNRNSRISKLNTLFWEDAVDSIKKDFKKISKKHIGFKNK